MNIFTYIGLRIKNTFISLSHADKDKCLNCKYCCDDSDYKNSETGYFCALSKCKFVTNTTKKYCYEYDEWTYEDMNTFFSYDDTLTFSGKTYIKEKLLGTKTSFDEAYEIIQDMRQNHRDFFAEYQNPCRYEKWYCFWNNHKSKKSKFSSAFDTLRDYFYTNVGSEGVNFVIIMFKIIFLSFYLLGRLFLFAYRLLLKLIKLICKQTKKSDNRVNTQKSDNKAYTQKSDNKAYTQKSNNKSYTHDNRESKKEFSDFNFDSFFGSNNDNKIIKEKLLNCPRCSNKLRIKNVRVGKTIEITCPVCKCAFRKNISY